VKIKLLIFGIAVLLLNLNMLAVSTRPPSDQLAPIVAAKPAHVFVQIPPGASWKSSRRNHYFAPDTITVPAGTTVTWVNEDGDVIHVIASADCIFTSPDIAGGHRASVLFKKPGVYKYMCPYHKFMHGKVVVK
jgi:plastocyanin